MLLRLILISFMLLSCTTLHKGPGNFASRGVASWYGRRFQGHKTANGERFDMHQLTAAHRTLPFGTLVRVRSLETQKEIRVRINDRGPYVDGRMIDLSYEAARQLGIANQGMDEVEIYVVDSVVGNKS